MRRTIGSLMNAAGVLFAGGLAAIGFAMALELVWPGTTPASWTRDAGAAAAVMGLALLLLAGGLKSWRAAAVSLRRCRRPHHRVYVARRELPAMAAPPLPRR